MMKPETAIALAEMMSVACRELRGYEGPIIITILPDRENHYSRLADDYVHEADRPNQPEEEFFYAQSFA